MPFNPQVLIPDPARRQIILPVLEAALQAADPAAAVARALSLSGDVLRVGQQQWRLSDYRRVILLGLGKAATPMAQAVLDAGVPVSQGLIVTKTGHGPENPAALTPVSILEAGHPTPDARSVHAGQRMADLAQNATADDLILLLISGGGSALLTLPAPGLSLDDLQQTTNLLLASGAEITEINTIRKHLSQIKGGQLARLAAPATLVSLILSDVLGNPLHAIASGPAAPDPSTWQHAWAIIQKYHLQKRLPPAVRQHLQLGRQGHLPETPKPGDPIFRRTHAVIVGDIARAAAAAHDAARAQGLNSVILNTHVQGEAREIAKNLVKLGRGVLAKQHPVAPPACLVTGGEVTVTLTGSGYGGRNQELALAAAMHLAQNPTEPISIVALATDGTDGPTDAAGGLVDTQTWSRALAAGLNPHQHLNENNSYPLLKATHDLLISGPTRTNVNDLYLVFILPQGASHD